ncbi:MAG: hypothetical protein JNM28_01710 [Armatimonadetes bacterium]|nr:hypothetical protein [Armatimonadota bacterium]
MTSGLLVTGFGAFRDIDENPSAWLAERMGGTVLAVGYADVDAFLDGLDPDTFDAWLMIGVHGAAQRMHLETVAKNSCGPGEDVHGVIAGPGRIDPLHPPQLAGTMFDKSFESDRAVLTVDAGGYLCNYLFFRGLSRFPEKRIGFLHVPRPEVMDLEAQLNEVRRIVASL